MCGVNKMTAASLRSRSICEEDLDNYYSRRFPEKTELATKYGMNIFHGKSKQELNETI